MLKVLQVTLIAQGDVPLSIVMTVCTTLGAVFLTPLLTKILAGTYVPVDAIQLSISTLQVNLNIHKRFIIFYIANTYICFLVNYIDLFVLRWWLLPFC